MAVERGDSSAEVGATTNDTPSTFEQSTLAGTTTTGNARLIVRDATQIAVIDTYNYWTSNTVEGVLDEIANLTGLDSNIQDQIDALVAVDVTHTDAISALGTDKLSRDGSDGMTGVLNTTTGRFISSRGASSTEAAFDLVSTNSIIPDYGERLFSVEDSGGLGLVIKGVANSFLGHDLVLEYLGGTGTFDSLVFNINSALGVIKFGSTAGGNKLGVSPQTNSITTDHVSELRLTSNNGGQQLLRANKDYILPRGHGVQDVGLTGTRWKNGYFSGTINATATPTQAAHLTRKDYVDTKAEDEAIAFAIALGG